MEGGGKMKEGRSRAEKKHESTDTRKRGKFRKDSKSNLKNSKDDYICKTTRLLKKKRHLTLENHVTM